MRSRQRVGLSFTLAAIAASLLLPPTVSASVNVATTPPTDSTDPAQEPTPDDGTAVPGTTPEVQIPIDDTPVDDTPIRDLTNATEPPQPATPPLVPVPTGCDPPAQPHVVFLGTVVDGDYRTKRFRIEQIRAGNPAPFADDDQIDIRYGTDQQYLVDGETYLVGAGVEPTLGILYSTVTPQVQAFGGDDVIGKSETDVDCVEIQSAAVTIHPDGSQVEGGVLRPITSAWIDVAGALALPIAAALGVIFLLALIGNGSRAAARIVADPDR